ncbi:MAG: TlpA family protein disulfide reductase [Gemmatimonadota bacterium]|nr:TlpA family protein disulfide reductase [Gemmatimonadota bacterium]MDH4349708.1 TlpA family protein disulfide reductase [Gemmatimonadota bacterium]MDH5197078.1 TlpA family protein disulfide reductase [Gemmatimonadota bacterium]
MASRGQWIAVGVVLGVIGFGVGAALLLTPEITRIEPGTRAPDYEVLSVTGDDTVRVSDFRGEVVLLNVWATWCGPCEQEMPSMERLQREMGPQGLRVVAISVDQGDVKDVREWVAERNLSFTVLHDPSGRIQQVYQTTGVPESFVLDRRGVIVKKIIGATEWDHPAQKALFRRLLASE